LGPHQEVARKALFITAWTFGIVAVAMSLTLRGRRLAAGYLAIGFVILTLYLVATRASIAPWAVLAPMAPKFAWAAAPAVLSAALFLIVSAMGVRTGAGAAIRSLQFLTSAIMLAGVALAVIGSTKALRAIGHDSNLAAWSSVAAGLFAGCLAASGALLGGMDALAFNPSDYRLAWAARRFVLGALLVLLLHGAIRPMLQNHEVGGMLGLLNNEFLLIGICLLAIEGCVGLCGAVRVARVGSMGSGRSGRLVFSTLGGVFVAGFGWVGGTLALGAPAHSDRAAQNGVRDAGQPRPSANPDWPQWCGSPSRNMASSATHLPENFEALSADKVEGLTNVKWVVPLGAGAKTMGSPVVSGGKIFIGGTLPPGDNREPAGVLWCFNEADGKLLWRLVSPNIHNLYSSLSTWGFCSTPTVDGDRVYLVGHLGDVLCLDTNGVSGGKQGPFDGGEHFFSWNRTRVKSELAPDGSRILEYTPGDAAAPSPWDANILWRFDMLERVRCWPYNALNSSILIRGDCLYVATCSTLSSYSDGSAKSIAEWKQKYGKQSYDSPSLIVLDKHTGKLLARDTAGIFEETFHGAHSSPAFGEVDGRTLLCVRSGLRTGRRRESRRTEAGLEVRLSQ
jgi:hypothetical protein